MTRVRIDDLEVDGRGRGKVGGKIALVSQALPGEEVTLRLDTQTKNTLQGRVGRLLRADAARLEHPCPHGFACTGCPLLGAQVALEDGFKLDKVRRAAADAAERVEPIVRPSPLFGYRHLAKMTFAPDARGQAKLGSFVAGTHAVVSNVACAVLAPPLRELVAQAVDVARRLDLPVDGTEGRGPGLRHLVMRHSRLRDEQLALVAVAPGAAAVGRAWVETIRQAVPTLVGAMVLEHDGTNNLVAGEVGWRWGEETVTEALGGFEHPVGPRSFFQINPVAAEKLVEVTLEMAGEGGLCVEGYAGVGAMTLPLASRFSRVLASEANGEAASLAARAAARHGLENVDVVHARFEEALAGWTQHGPLDVAVLDPPRKGLGPRAAAMLAEAAPRRIVLLSCQPTTLAHDLPVLGASGFDVRRIVPIDQFPRTAHVETVTLLERR